jgi:uncharacterized damage-inducible protein DinB
MFDFKRLFLYNYEVRRTYLSFLSQLNWNEVVKDRGISHGSIRNVFVHIVAFEDFWIHHVLSGKVDEWRDYNFSEFVTLSKIFERMKFVEGKTRDYLGRIREDQLYGSVEYRRKDGLVKKRKVENILMNVVTDEIHHRGEVIAVLYQMDMKLPPMEWLYYEEDRLNPFGI